MDLVFHKKIMKLKMILKKIFKSKPKKIKNILKIIKNKIFFDLKGYIFKQLKNVELKI